MDIAQFIADRQNERAAIAQAAFDVHDGRTPRTPGAWHTPGEDPETPSSFELEFEPETILADIEVWRTVLALHSDPDGGAHECPAVGPDGRYTTYEVACPTLRAMAAPDAEHPDYDVLWSV